VREETIADNPTRQWLDTELARTKTENAALRVRAQSLASAVSQYRSSAEVLGVRDVEQQDLERTVKAAEAKYLLYVQKREEARISDALDKDRIANVVVAESPSVDFKPERKPSVAMLPLLLGGALMLSFALALAYYAFAFSMPSVFAILMAMAAATLVIFRMVNLYGAMSVRQWRGESYRVVAAVSALAGVVVLLQMAGVAVIQHENVGQFWVVATGLTLVARGARARL